MSIFTALFRGMWPLTQPKSRPPHWTAYLEQAVNTAAASVSVIELTDHANHYSGYVREVALARCVKLARPDLLPIIVGRLNDWVPQVRQAARSALMTLLPAMPVEQLLATLPAVLRLFHAERVSHTEWVIDYERKFLRHVSVQNCITGAQGDDIHIARACFYILKKYQLLDPNSLVRLFLAGRSDIVIARQVIELCAGLPENERREQYRLAMQSHFGEVRTIALRDLLSFDDGAKELAIEALFDTQSSVRSLAILYLQARHFDLQAYYRNKILGCERSKTLTRVGLVALASLGNVDDIEFIQRFATADRSVVRFSAVSSWLKLDSNAKDLIALQALRDPSVKVRKFALQAVRKHGAHIPFELVREVLEEKRDYRMLLLFAESNKWNWLECIARIATLNDSVASGLWGDLAADLKRWISSTKARYETPSATQHALFSSAAVSATFAKLLNQDPQKIMHLELALLQRKAV